MKEIIFVTSNENKLREAKQLLSIDIISKNIDLRELQSVNIEGVIEEKLKHGYQILKKPIIVEDTGLFFDALHGFPGALIKMLIDRVGRDGIVKILKDFKDKTATAKCAIGFTEDGKDFKVFIGEVQGRIVSPRGESGFGWDPIFQPENFIKTFAEMSSEEKNAISPRSKAFKEFKNFLER